MSRKLDRCCLRSFFARYLLPSVASFFSSMHRSSNPSPSKSYMHKQAATMHCRNSLNQPGPKYCFDDVCWASVQIIEHTHTTIYRPFVWDYPGKPVQQVTSTHSHPWGRRRIWADNKVCFELARVVRSNLQISWIAGLTKWTASAFNWRWISIPAVLVTISTVKQNLLHPLLTSSITACHLLDFMVQGKIKMPFLLQPSQFILAWDRHRITLACIHSGLVVQKLHHNNPSSLP